MPVVRALIAALVLGGLTAAQDHVSFPTLDGWTIHADLYGTGDRGVVLAHGGRFEKGSWEKQARALVNAGQKISFTPQKCRTARVPFVQIVQYASSGE